MLKKKCPAAFQKNERSTAAINCYYKHKLMTEAECATIWQNTTSTFKIDKVHVWNLFFRHEIETNVKIQ